METPGIRILFIQDNGINESLALTELSAYLRARGHATALLLAREEPRLDHRILAFSPALVVLPCNVFGHLFVLRMAQRLRTLLPNVPVLLGGTLPTFSPSILEHPAIDMILVGEAELPVAELAARIARGRPPDGIPGIWLKQDGRSLPTGPGEPLPSLEELPPAHRGLYFGYPFLRRFPWKKFSTGRGCHNRCAFCYNNLVRSLYASCAVPFVRRRSPAQACDEVDAVRRAAPLSWVHFSDDLFVTDHDWLDRFCTAYRSRFTLPFSCNSAADRMTPEAARMLAAAGCRMVAIGVETASEESRIRWLGKPITNAVIERAAQTIRTAGMSLVTFNMVGLPGESLHDAIATLRYSRRLGASATRVTMAIPLPGTRMALDAADRGSLDPRLARDFTAPIDLSVNPYGPYYATRDDRAIENLLNLAPLVRATDPALPLAPLLRRLPRQASRPARIWMSLQEKAIYRFSLLDGLRFYLHTGNPWLRTTNYVALI